MIAIEDRIAGGLWGLLVADACGVPYEFRQPDELPPREQIDMVPPQGFVRTYSHVPLGTWSDDGAQALCLLASLLDRGQLDLADFGQRLQAWLRQGYMAVGHQVFDVGNQTSLALQRLQQGLPPSQSGLRGERNNGNGSLMRALPLTLWHQGDDATLVRDAHLQSLVTHAHPRAQVCCALYCLWARAELAEQAEPWGWAVQRLRELYANHPIYLDELTQEVLPFGAPGGSGYVVDCLHSARAACAEETYAAVVRAAIALGYDTDTTACVAGGIAGIRHGLTGIPEVWRQMLRGPELFEDLLSQLVATCGL
ncbi:MAG: ADP-ribosylglycohydrolase [Puniceicoccaceae bacterium 5H]|nr:MAG: ADP-ribosylglycohydrolase [Puniceicoccaceae bacterium 5H]